MPVTVNRHSADFKGVAVRGTLDLRLVNLQFIKREGASHRPVSMKMNQFMDLLAAGIACIFGICLRHPLRRFIPAAIMPLSQPHCTVTTRAQCFIDRAAVAVLLCTGRHRDIRHAFRCAVEADFAKNRAIDPVLLRPFRCHTVRGVIINHAK